MKTSPAGAPLGNQSREERASAKWPSCPEAVRSRDDDLLVQRENLAVCGSLLHAKLQRNSPRFVLTAEVAPAEGSRDHASEVSLDSCAPARQAIRARQDGGAAGGPCERRKRAKWRNGWQQATGPTRETDERPRVDLLTYASNYVLVSVTSRVSRSLAGVQPQRAAQMSVRDSGRHSRHTTKGFSKARSRRERGSN